MTDLLSSYRPWKSTGGSLKKTEDTLDAVFEFFQNIAFMIGILFLRAALSMKPAIT
jgi:xylose isomerase